MSDNGVGLWSVRGVNEETRKVAAEAAKAAAVPMGQWLSYAIRHTASDRGAEVVSDRESDRGGAGASDRESDRGHLAVVATLFAGLGQIGAVKGNGGVAERARMVLDQYLSELAIEALPPRRRRERLPAGEGRGSLPAPAAEGEGSPVEQP